MSENQNRGIDDLSRYDAMTTEELEEILRLDAENQESDTDEILYIMEVLTERKRNNGHAGKTALEAYESFQQNYMPETDNTIPMKPKRRSPRWVRGLTATAAVLAILFAGSITAKAFGINIWKVAIQWTQETFHFGEWGNSATDDDLPYTSLREALEKRKITTLLVPNWFPDGYELVDIKVEHTPGKNIYKAEYSDGKQFLVMTVQDYLDGDPIFVEQNDGLVEKYEVAGTTYYLFSNYEYNRAVWLIESYECDISGEVTIDDLKKMIDSIQKGS